MACFIHRSRKWIQAAMGLTLLVLATRGDGLLAQRSGHTEAIGKAIAAARRVLTSTATVSASTLNGCMTLTGPGPNGTFSRANGLSIELDIRIQDAGQQRGPRQGGSQSRQRTSVKSI